MADLYFELVERGSVTRDELNQLAPLLPSRIDIESAEQGYYRTILLPSADAPSAALSRKRSIQLLLEITNFLSREPRANEVRWVLYSGYDSNGNSLIFNNLSLEKQRLRWWVYHANDLCHIAHEALLKFALDTLDECPSGIGTAHLIGRCANEIITELEPAPESWLAMLSTLEPTTNAFDSNDPNSEVSLTDDLIRSGRVDAHCTPQTAANAVQLLATLHHRTQANGPDLRELLGDFNPEISRSLLSEIQFLTQYGDEPIQRTIERVIEERVIRRHLWVALRKLRYQGDYTFLIETEDGKLRLREKDGPIFTNPRLGPAITFLKDVGLIGSDGLTAAGREATGV